MILSVDDDSLFSVPAISDGPSSEASCPSDSVRNTVTLDASACLTARGFARLNRRYLDDGILLNISCFSRLTV